MTTSEPKSPASSAPASTESKRAQAGRLLSWVIAPILAVGAVVLQINLDVPTGEIVPRTSKKKGPARAQARAEARAQARDKRRRENRWDARPAVRVGRLRESWLHRPLAEELIDRRFRRHHDPLMRTAVSVARRQLEIEQRASVQIYPLCHTIRCALELCGPEDRVGAIAEILPQLTDRVGPLWHTLVEVESTREPRADSATSTTDVGDSGMDVTGKRKPGKKKSGQKKSGQKKPAAADAAPAQICRRWIASFERDAVTRLEIRGPGESGAAPKASPKPSRVQRPNSPTVPDPGLTGPG